MCEAIPSAPPTGGVVDLAVSPSPAPERRPRSAATPSSRGASRHGAGMYAGEHFVHCLCPCSASLFLNIHLCKPFPSSLVAANPSRYSRSPRRGCALSFQAGPGQGDRQALLLRQRHQRDGEVSSLCKLDYVAPSSPQVHTVENNGHGMCTGHFTPMYSWSNVLPKLPELKQHGM